MATGTGLVPVRSITVKSTGRTYNYAKLGRSAGGGYKILSRILDDIMLGKAAHDFGWTVHSVYDNRFDAMPLDKRAPKVTEKTAAFPCRTDGGRPEDFYFALLPARRFCN